MWEFQSRRRNLRNDVPFGPAARSAKSSVQGGSLAAQMNGAPSVHQLRDAGQAMQQGGNRTGLPDSLKSGLEALSGIALDHVRVHRNSSKPAQLNAHAYAEGNQIHLASGQERHLPHEAWHVVQQAQNRVRPTIQAANGTAVNNDTVLEREADIMGAKAQSHGVRQFARAPAEMPAAPVQRQIAAVAQPMVMALDSVQALAERGVDLTSARAKSARITTNAMSDRVLATGETVVAPHQVATPDLATAPGWEAINAGALADIGLTEELRLFGHGQTTRLSGDEAVQIGDYTPASLTALLIDMSLPENYQGEIYLSGCLTAVGPGYGFLGKFYALISQYCPGVSVRGNLGNATTFGDGTQGVWTGDCSKADYAIQMQVYSGESQRLLGSTAAIEQDARAGLVSSADAKRQIDAITDQLYAVQRQRDAFLRTVYDTSGARTVTLPSEDVQASNGVKAVVTGAVTSASDVAALLDRVSDNTLDAVRDTLGSILTRSQAEAEELVRETEKIDTGGSFNSFGK